jgi:hypothetical protein
MFRSHIVERERDQWSEELTQLSKIRDGVHAVVGPI